MSGNGITFKNAIKLNEHTGLSGGERVMYFFLIISEYSSPREKKTQNVGCIVLLIASIKLKAKLSTLTTEIYNRLMLPGTTVPDLTSTEKQSLFQGERIESGSEEAP